MTCPRCDTPLPNRDQRRNGTYCRECRRRYNQEWRKRNPEKVVAIQQREQRRRREDPAYRAQKLAREQALRDKNREQVRESNRRYAAKNREARWAYDIRRRFGLSLDEYRAILARGCAICGSHERVCLDHDHATGQVRDALCVPCNSTLGFMQDSPERLRAAADYLEEHRPPHR